MHQKPCFKCHVIQPLAEFYKHPQMADGHLGKCKSCTKKDVAEREAKKSKDPDWKEKELARHRAKSARARLESRFPNAEASKRGKEKWLAANQHKRKAHQKVSNALRDGGLTRKPCEICGEPRAQAHHDDYSKPLDVKWLCVKHHAERHVELNRLNRKYE